MMAMIPPIWSVALGSTRRLFQPQPLHVLVEGLDIAVGNGAVIDPFLVGAVDDLVVDVGIVADVGDIVAGILQIAEDHVEDHVGPGMADMAVVVDRYPADIHAGLAGDQRNEGFFFTRKGIVDTQRH